MNISVNKEEMTFVIDWTLDQNQFRAQIRRMVKTAAENGKVLPLPLFPQPGKPALELLTVILSRINCDGCDAPCCKSNPNREETSLMPSEYMRLKLYGDSGMLYLDGQYYIKMPCHFLQNNRCSIYRERPFACIVYPFNPGGSEGLDRRLAMAMDSRCPEARKLTKAIYMTLWRLKQGYQSLSAVDKEIIWL